MIPNNQNTVSEWIWTNESAPLLRQVGMGGVFRMKSGLVKAHVNPDFEVLPENYYDPEQMKCVKDFLQFYQFSAPLLCFSTLWTEEPPSTH